METQRERVDRWLTSHYIYSSDVATEETTQQFIDLIEEMKDVIRHQYDKYDDGDIDDYKVWTPLHVRLVIDKPSRISISAYKKLEDIDMRIGELANRLCL